MPAEQTKKKKTKNKKPEESWDQPIVQVHGYSFTCVNSISFWDRNLTC